MSKALVIGGGAPNATFMAGVLHRLIEKDELKNFETITSSGAGALVALVALAPKGMSALDALENLTNSGVSDEIYQLFPVNYKVFQKPGTAADWFRNAIAATPFGRYVMDQQGKSDAFCLWSDLIQFGWAAMTPTAPDWLIAPGMCAPTPWVTELVDFEKVNGLKQQFEMVAYNVTDKKLNWFHNRNNEITVDAFHSAMAFPFLYPPHQYQGDWFIEGAAVSDVPYEGLFNIPSIKDVVILDVLGYRALIDKPDTLWDGFTQLIIDTIVANAQASYRAFMLKNELRKVKGERTLNVYRVDARKAAHSPDALTWKRSNLKAQFEYGRVAADEMLKDLAAGNTDEKKVAAKADVTIAGKAAPKPVPAN